MNCWSLNLNTISFVLHPSASETSPNYDKMASLWKGKRSLQLNKQPKRLKTNLKKFRPVCSYVQISVYIVLNIITGLASEETDIQPCLENETQHFGLWTELKKCCIEWASVNGSFPQWLMYFIKATAMSVLVVVFAGLKHYGRWSSATGRARKCPCWILKT